ncbi:MAG: carboxyvinyl-carboxyphosphonate phosphorylmutase [Bacillus thermozeamaize]|uniref:2-methylisocitrate lyase n=1 Tax=Bacillus thermozeamaize TaxID=230954 RepID=A0A1Y3PW88_9BACI|nr:MAG: carboxyvinyl-carboxyphosphonate phosphorylmutase [Bacillus thermozeamaize]
MRKRLKQRLEEKTILMAPGAYDALTAILCERAGFEALYLTGAGVSYSTLGKSDVGLITMSEMVSKATYICEAVSIPVIADGDNGYGNAINVMRTVREYERAGVAAIQLEDQVFPKRCGHLSNKSLISTEEMVAKIHAAVDARRDENFLIVARTDARAVEGLEEAIERAIRYEEAGADVIFVEAPESEAEMRKIARSLQKPLVANMVEGGKTPILSAEQLQEIGYALVIFPNSVTRVIAKAAGDFYRELKQTGITTHYYERMLQFKELNQILGIERIRQLEQKYDERNFK